MDVKYRIRVTNVPTKTDAVLAAAVAAVDITPVVEERVRQFTICSDVTGITAPGVIDRTIIAEFTEEFELMFPTEDNRYYAVWKAFRNRFESMLPANVEELVELGDFCP